MTGRRRSRLAALTAGVGAVLLLAVASTPMEQTEAAWVDRENVQANLSTMTVPPPVLASTCTTNPGLLGAAPTITIEWTPPAGYSPTSARYGAGTSVGGIAIGTSTTYTTTTLSGGRQRTVFSGGLLSGLLGGQASVGVAVAVAPDTTPATTPWLSKWATATGGSALLGVNPYCTVNPAP